MLFMLITKYGFIFHVCCFIFCSCAIPPCFHGCRRNKRKFFFASENKQLNSFPYLCHTDILGRKIHVKPVCKDATFVSGRPYPAAPGKPGAYLILLMCSRLGEQFFDQVLVCDTLVSLVPLGLLGRKNGRGNSQGTWFTILQIKMCYSRQNILWL